MLLSCEDLVNERGVAPIDVLDVFGLEARLIRPSAEANSGTTLVRMSDHLYLYVLPNEFLPAAGRMRRGKRSRQQASCAVTWTKAHGYQVFRPEGFNELQRALRTADEVIGFDLTGSHYQSLLSFGASGVPVLTDLHELLSRHGEEPIPLRSVASATFGRASFVDEEKLVQLWKKGEHERVIRACKRRVGLIRKLHEHVLLHRQFRFYDKDGHVIRIYTDPGVVPSGRFPDERQSARHWSPEACFARARNLDRAVSAFKRTSKLPKL